MPAVAALMSMHGMHSVFVFDYERERDETDAFVGIVSDLDLVAAAWAGLETRTAGQSAVTPILTVTTEDALEHAAELMVENSLSHLCAVDPAPGGPWARSRRSTSHAWSRGRPERLDPSRVARAGSAAGSSHRVKSL